MAVSLKEAHFPQDIMLMGVRWYVAYPLSDRHVEERMEARGVLLDHATIQHWVVTYSPQREAAFHQRTRPVGHSWRVGLELLHVLKTRPLVVEAGAKGLTTAERFSMLAA